MFLLLQVFCWILWHRIATSLKCAESACIWTVEAEDAFQMLKQLLTEAPVLCYTKLECDFVIDTNASLTRVAAILFQVQDDQEKVIAAAIFTWQSAREELLCHQKGTPSSWTVSYLSLWTSIHPACWPCCSLLAILNVCHCCSEGQTAHWLQELQQYNFWVEHWWRVRHNNADVKASLSG